MRCVIYSKIFTTFQNLDYLYTVNVHVFIFVKSSHNSLLHAHVVIKFFELRIAREKIQNVLNAGKIWFFDTTTTQ